MFIVQCCVCGKVRCNTNWIYLSKKELESSKISHTYCPECARAEMKKINFFRHGNNKFKITSQSKEK